ncbi:MAG: ParB N-terminal domain-containing protein [Candidatus Omnitrophica bacterium]|nr:ParB N-terminal domain-containing protein [Candidatus Omnitrophota bacterium]
MTINNLLKEKEIDIDDLILDPNNPRFSKHLEDITPLEKFEDENVQEDAYRRMTDPKNNFEIDVLLSAIKADGFIYVDKIFVRKINKKYLVVEGNRRITAIKKLLRNYENHVKGYEVDDKLLKQITRLPCVVIDVDGPEAEDQIQKILGLRHHGSILPWKPLPAAFNLYQRYMAEYCLLSNSDPRGEENFLYDPVVTKKVAAIFSVKWTNVREQIKLYRVYLQLLEVSHHHSNVESQNSFSMIEETLGKPTLRKYFDYDDNRSVFSDEGAEKILDLYFGLKDKPAVITEASAGSSNVRDFSFVVSEGTDEDLRRITEDRERASLIKSEVETKRSHQSLQNTLLLVMEKLNQINLGEIKPEGFAPNEKDCISRIDQKMLQLKRAAGLL